MTQNDFVTKGLTKLGPSVLKLQVASRVLMNPAPAVKKVKQIVPKKDLKSTQKTQESVVREDLQTLPASAAGVADALSVYKAELRAIIDQNKYYPTMSRRLGQTGTVVVAFTLLHDGNIINIRIDKPSQYERLNASALEAVRKVERFKPIPKEVGEAKMDIKVPVKFVTI